ncbi:MAG: sorbosone dehydrogenase family protein [Polaromonas sp.]|uniref:PQQ-dependent sugar dehydrogenase n=1 Tax=Polaromonas sp. TaxID=1869339 RepID=UPI0027307B56|nr:sorbosone dehydrogenase family protein [Polaromonas sp.]MDP2449449.1 sorbosone dehydrogenase family protein [Polaromonas sp.]MDP3247938.1 sorbosone dehydrogenase family protein [Polaromonas sp.]MDP3754403.1 sorbosone dehydrogenase family protein [Polaromonas sp.]MDP3826389.1 sorbosone dehydrogenase family protein [Polaromonas sp.]
MQTSKTLNSTQHRLRAVTLCLLLAAGLTACGDTSKLPPGADLGATPTLPPPTKTLIPTVHIAEATGWPAGVLPVPAAGLRVTTLASGLDHPRWLHVLPNGDVLVAESNKPAQPQAGFSLKGWITGLVMKRAGAGVPSANRITLLRDADGDGVAETRTVFLQGLNSPFGMALIGNNFYVANTNGVVRFPYETGQTAITAPAVTLTDLPGGPINHHWTKSLIASPDGSKLYATVGSNSNVGENGMEAEAGRAAIWEINPQTGAKRLFATGLRNPNGMGWAPGGALWTVVNERDEIGSDLVPDYLTSVKDGAFYGWPYSYFGQNVDERVKPPRPDLVAAAVAPDYALGNHVAPLGMAFAEGSALPPALSSGVFVGEHGSWNRKPRSGYKVVFVPFKDKQPSGLPIDVLTGFVSPDGKAWGRPVGVAMDKRGALLVADDVGNVVWRVSGQAPR